eukprot:scaffold8551_cov31-Phaeocystis_antarctica.AAC.2
MLDGEAVTTPHPHPHHNPSPTPNHRLLSLLHAGDSEVGPRHGADLGPNPNPNPNSYPDPDPDPDPDPNPNPNPNPNPTPHPNQAYFEDVLCQLLGHVLSL